MKKTLLALALTAALGAQAADSCVLPERIDPPALAPVDCRNDVRTFDYYLLSISWSPQFCSDPKRRDKPGNDIQCRDNRFDFVVHGLWPQIAGVRDPKCGNPRNCEASRVDAGTIRNNLCLVPSASLIQGEWQKHGSCSGYSPAEYYAAIDRLWNGLAKPDLRELKRKAAGQVTVQDIVAAFVAANDGKLPREAVDVQLGRGGRLDEVHICYTRDFAPTACESRRPGNRSVAIAE